MADLNKEDLGEVDRLAKPAEEECDLLGKNEGREEALKEVVEEKKEEEPKLPKLSAAEFRAYNSMAEHMDYFVSAILSCSSHLISSVFVSINLILC